MSAPLYNVVGEKGEIWFANVSRETGEKIIKAYSFNYDRRLTAHPIKGGDKLRLQKIEQ